MTPPLRWLFPHALRALGLCGACLLLFTTSVRAQGDPAATDKLSKKPASRPTIPDFSGVLTGVYTYGAGYDGKEKEQRVKFTLQLRQEPGSPRFTGQIDEEYTGFGTPKQGRLWAKVAGQFVREGGELKIRFKKTYLDHEQPEPTYNGIFDPERRSFDGYWTFPSGQRGSFTLQLALSE